MDTYNTTTLQSVSIANIFLFPPNWASGIITRQVLFSMYIYYYFILLISFALSTEETTYWKRDNPFPINFFLPLPKVRKIVTSDKITFYYLLLLYTPCILFLCNIEYYLSIDLSTYIYYLLLFCIRDFYFTQV